MSFAWTQTFAILRFHDVDFASGADLDVSAWPWVPVSSEVTLFHLGVDDEGGMLVDDGSMARVRAYCRAALWCDGVGQSRDDHPFAAHDDPRGILIASEARTRRDGASGAEEWSPAKAMQADGASYETWIARSIDWGFWIPKPESTEECLVEIEALLTPEEHDEVCRTHEKSPNQYRRDEARLGSMAGFLGRALGERLRRCRSSPPPRAQQPRFVGFAPGDRISHAEHGLGTIAELDPNGEVLLARFEGTGAQRVPYRSVEVLRRETDEERTLRESAASAPASAPQTCPRCEGRGWIASQEASAFPSRCSCKQ